MKIIVPIMAQTVQDAARQAAALAADPNADWVELRLDPLPDAERLPALAAVRAAAIDTDLAYVLFTSGSTGAP